MTNKSRKGLRWASIVLLIVGSALYWWQWEKTLVPIQDPAFQAHQKYPTAGILIFIAAVLALIDRYHAKRRMGPRPG